MDAERWRRLSPLLDALLEADPAERGARLASIRGEDPALAAELERLLALEQGHDDFLDTPLVAPLPGARPGVEIGPYRLERMLGEGGMGQVWLARRSDGLYQRRVALKLLRPGLADPNLRLRFTREREILARLEHAHIARLLDAGISADQQPYLALEYVDGEPITDWCAARGLDIRSLLRLFLQVCDAVSHAHANLIVHRDLKPSNILVTPLDEARLLDFGIAKLLDSPELPDQTRTGVRAFTLHYAAPEQIRGEPVTTMTDVYALGAVLYELLAGAKPCEPERKSDAQWEEAILGTDPVRPSLALQRRADADRGAAPALQRRARAVAGDLDNIVLKALSKRGEQRYASVEALALDLQRYLDGKPVLARPQRLGYRVRKYVRRHRWPLSTALLAAAVLTTALGLVAWQSRLSIQEAARAQAMQDFVVSLFQDAGNLPEAAPLDVRQLLDSGVERGGAELGGQPIAHAGLLGVIARLRLGLGDDPQALALLQRQSALLADADDVPDSLRLEAGTDMGHALRRVGQAEACIARMQPLQSLARHRERRLPAQAGEFYSQLGRCHRLQGEREQAQVLFLRALALRRDRLPGDAGIAENLTDLAGLHADAGNHPRALQDLTAALEQLHATAGERHPLNVGLLHKACTLRWTLGQRQAAVNACADAAALSSALHGPQHRGTNDARRRYADMLAASGRLDEAEAELRQVQAWLVTRLGSRHPDLAEAMHALALVQWERGGSAAALRELQRAVPMWRDAGRQAPLAAGLADLGMMLHGTGRHAHAREALEEALALADRAPGAGRPGLRGEILMRLGEAEAALGEDGRAQARFDRAFSAALREQGPDDPRTRRIELSMAVFQAQRGDEEARHRLRRLGALSDRDPRLQPTVWLARAHAAAAECAQARGHGGDRDQARATLDAVNAAARASLPESAAITGEIQRLRQACTS